MASDGHVRRQKRVKRFPFDEGTYAKAKPYFLNGVAHFRETSPDVAAMVRALLKHLNEVQGISPEIILRMKPYIVRFIDDVNAGTISLEAAENADEATALAADTPPHDPNDEALTIAEAKQRLARSLGVEPSSIKILIEA